MRIHGVQLNGLDSPRGAHQLACEPGYNVVVCSDARAAERLAAVVRALLCDPGALRGRGRADVSISLGRQAFRVVADLTGQRLALARYDDSRPVRIASDADGILCELRRAGLPESRDLERVCIWPSPGDESHLELEQRVKQLEHALSELGALADDVDGLDERVEAYRVEESARDETLAAVREHRGALEDDLERLSRTAASQGLAWGGALVCALAAAGAVELGGLLWALSAAGAAGAVVGGLSVRAARQGAGRVRARLASLRSAERKAQARFTRETREFRARLEALELDSPDALVRVVEGYRHAVEELEQTRTQLEAARPEGGDEDDPLDGMIASAARVAGLDARELRHRLAPVLPVYLRALSAGRCTAGERDDSGSWRIRRADGPATLGALGGDERARVCLGFRLALLEIMAPQLRMPLLVGPGEARPGEEIARALRRLASVGQVIHFCVADDPAMKHADHVQRVC